MSMKAAVVPITAAEASRASEAYQRSFVVHETPRVRTSPIAIILSFLRICVPFLITMLSRLVC